jgi:hypothetical protein
VEKSGLFGSILIGRKTTQGFMRSDTLVPDLTNTQAWNRFSYVNNSPILYNDPSGHLYCMPNNPTICTDDADNPNPGGGGGGGGGSNPPGDTGNGNGSGGGTGGSGSNGGPGGEDSAEEDLNGDTSGGGTSHDAMPAEANGFDCEIAGNSTTCVVVDEREFSLEELDFYYNYYSFWEEFFNISASLFTLLAGVGTVIAPSPVMVAVDLAVLGYDLLTVANSGSTGRMAQAYADAASYARENSLDSVTMQLVRSNIDGRSTLYIGAKGQEQQGIQIWALMTQIAAHTDF